MTGAAMDRYPTLPVVQIHDGVLHLAEREEEEEEWLPPGLATVVCVELQAAPA